MGEADSAATDDERRTAFELMDSAAGYANSGRANEAFELLDELGRRFGASSDPEIVRAVAMGLQVRATLFQRIRDHESAARILADALLRTRHRPEPEFRTLTADLLYLRGASLVSAGHGPEAIGLFDDIVTRCGTSPEPADVQRCAEALHAKAAAYSRSGLRDEALRALDDALARLDGRDEPDLAFQVANILVAKGSILLRSGAGDAGLDLLTSLVRSHRETTDLRTLECVISALRTGVQSRFGEGRTQEAIALLDENIRALDASSELASALLVSFSLVTKANVLLDVDDPHASLVASRRVLQRSGKRDEPEFVRPVADALWLQARALSALELDDEAAAAYDTLIARFADNGSPPISAHVARARLQRAGQLTIQDRFAEALEHLEDILRRHGPREGHAPRADLHTTVTRASLFKSNALFKMDRLRAARMAVYETMALVGHRQEGIEDVPPMLEKLLADITRIELDESLAPPPSEPPPRKWWQIWK